MGKPTRQRIVQTLLDDYGVTYAHEARLRLRDTPAPLFQLLCLSLLLSARIPARNACRAARALIEAGLTTPRKMAEASWQDRVDVITWHGYKRYDERTATMLGDSASHLIDRYGGDLRNLRDEAERDRKREHALLQQFKGIGPVGADIFLREGQSLWNEVYPFADGKVLAFAERLGLGNDPGKLARLVERHDFPRLLAALIRVGLGHKDEELRERAAA